MFNKTKNNITVIASTKINKDTSIEGQIISKNDIRLDGFFTGKINTKKKIIIGKNGTLIGKLNCENLIVEGSIQGEAKVSDNTSLLASSSFKGILSTQKLCVEEGAFFDGDCKTILKSKFNDLGNIKAVPKDTKSNESDNTLDKEVQNTPEVEFLTENAPKNH